MDRHFALQRFTKIVLLAINYAEISLYSIFNHTLNQSHEIPILGIFTRSLTLRRKRDLKMNTICLQKTLTQQERTCC